MAHVPLRGIENIDRLLKMWGPKLRPWRTHAVAILLFGTSVESFIVPAAFLRNAHASYSVGTLELGSVLNDENHNDDSSRSASRRSLLQSLPFLSLATAITVPPPAGATLVQFPCTDGSLMNTYHFMRAGESLLEAEGILSTNPLFLTNREAALSQKGEEQVHEACRKMQAYGLAPSVVKFSLAANAMDTADIVSMDLQVGRNRLVPEYTYMDQRGVGRWDMLPMQSTQEAVWAMDVKEAGKEGLGGRPTAHEDGTPNETLSNQVTRLRQLISLLETSLSGDDILLIFPDGTGPAVLSCLIAGIPLDRVHELDFEPGEVRLDVTHDSVLAMLPATPTDAYQATIARGNKQLEALRAINAEDVVNVREQRYEAEVKEEQKALAKKKQEEQDRIEKERQQQVAAAAVQKESAFAASDKEISMTNLLTMGALGLVGSMVAFRSEKSNEKKAAKILAQMEEDDSTTTRSLTTTKASNETATGVPLSLDKLDAMQDLMDEQAVFDKKEEGSSSSPELTRMEQLIQEAPIEIPEFQSVEEERMAIAERAMQEYMDQDDGGDAWLGVMSDIIAEDD